MQVVYTKLAADGTDLPVDSTEKHMAVRVTRPASPGWSLILAAYRAKGAGNFKKSQDAAAAHDAYGWPWRAPTPEEAFLASDRTDPANSLPKVYFPDAEEYETTWTNLPDAESPGDYAWYVNLGNGYAGRVGQGFRYGVRAVCAGQS